MPPKAEPDNPLSIKNHAAAIARELWPLVAAIPRALWRGLIYTRVGRYIIVPILVLILGRLLVNLSPVLPGCEKSAHATPGQLSTTCEATKEDVHDVTLDILLFVLGLLASTALERYGLRELFAHDRKIAHEAQRHPFLAELGATRFEQTYNLLTGLAHNSYVVPSSEAMNEWFEVFFTESPGRYRGVDTHLPSHYLQRYKWYLDEHEVSLKDRADKGLSAAPDVRVLAVDQNELGNDYIDNEKLYRDFVNWHTDNGVEVYWMSRAEVRRLCKKYKIGTSDVGQWEDYGVLFENLPDGGVELAMRFKGARRRGKVSYVEVTEFMDNIVRSATRLTEVPPDLDIFGGDLANRWEDYVEPVERERVLGPFLDDVLSGCELVLDAAAGIGCESIYLLKADGEPYSVFSNEVDGRFAEMAERRAEKAHVSINLTKHRWEGLPGTLEGNIRFNAVLVLGNSICMVLDEEHRRRCLRAFFDSLRPGGVIVIDERNFTFILDNRDAVLRDPLATLPFAINGDVMYHGDTIRGFPTTIEDEQLTWSFFENEPPMRDGRELSGRHIPEADIRLYPFKHGELYRMLHEAGFVDIDVYADLDLVGGGHGNPATTAMPSVEAIGNRAFLTYVARRSG